MAIPGRPDPDPVRDPGPVDPDLSDPDPVNPYPADPDLSDPTDPANPDGYPATDPVLDPDDPVGGHPDPYLSPWHAAAVALDSVFVVGVHAVEFDDAVDDAGEGVNAETLETLDVFPFQGSNPETPLTLTGSACTLESS